MIMTTIPKPGRERMLHSAGHFMLSYPLDPDHTVVFSFDDVVLRISVHTRTGFNTPTSIELGKAIRQGKILGDEIVIGEVSCGGTVDRDDLRVSTLPVDTAIALDALEQFY